MNIIERAHLMEAMQTFRKKLKTSLAPVEGSVSKMRKPLNAKAAVKTMGAKLASPAITESLREGRSSIINSMLKKIGAAKRKGMKMPGSAGGKMSMFGNVGLTTVNHHGALTMLQKPTKRNMVCIKSIMNSDRSAVTRAGLRENAMVAAEKKGMAKGAPIAKAGMDSYNKNRLITKGNLKTSLLGSVVQKGAEVAKRRVGSDLMGAAKQAVRTGTTASAPARIAPKKKYGGGMPLPQGNSPF